MMCYYLNVQFQGQRVNVTSGLCNSVLPQGILNVVADDGRNM